MAEVIIIAIKMSDKDSCEGCIMDNDACYLFRDIMIENGLPNCEEGYIYQVRENLTKKEMVKECLCRR